MTRVNLIVINFLTMTKLRNVYLPPLITISIIVTFHKSTAFNHTKIELVKMLEITVLSVL